MSALNKLFFTWLIALSSLPLLAQQPETDITEAEARISSEELSDSLRIELNQWLARQYLRIDLDRSDSLANASIVLAEEFDDQRQIANGYSMMGLVQKYKRNLPLSLEYHTKALKIRQEINDQRSICDTYLNIGEVQRLDANRHEAINYFKRSLNLAKAIGYTQNESSCYNNIGLTFELGQEYDSALVYFTKAVETKRSINDVRGLASTQGNIGNIYYYQGKIKAAIGQYKKVFGMAEELGDERLQALMLNNMGFMYLDLAEHETAIEYCNRSLQKAEALGNVGIMQMAYQNLFQTYQSLSDFETALDYHIKWKTLQDSVSGVRSRERLAEMQAQLNSEQQKKEIALLTVENENQDLQLSRNRILFIGLGLVLVLVIILVFVVLANNRQKQRANHLLENQNQEISAQKNIIEEKNKDILDSIKYAKRIQQAILPPDRLVKEYLQDSFILYRPKDIVSGDFYWMEQKGDTILFAAVDCTGHGVPGAFMSIVGHNALNQAVNEQGITKPAAILDHVNAQVNETLRQDIGNGMVRDGMDLALCSLDYNSKKLQFAGAQNPLYHIRNGEIQVTKGDLQPIGSFLEDLDKPFTNHEIQLQEGDCVYVFSDGFADQFGGPKGKKFKYSQFRDVLLEIHQIPMVEQREQLEAKLEDWMGEVVQIDDICVIGVRV